MARRARIVGLDRLEKKFKALPAAVETEIRLAMESAAADIVRLAQSLVPVRSGRLRHSIGWTWGSAPRGSVAIAEVSTRAKRPTLTIYAGNDAAFYARWVEFGTAPHKQGGIFKGSMHPGTTAQPFFYPAYRAGRKGAKRKVAAAARRAARKVAKGA